MLGSSLAHDGRGRSAMSSDADPAPPRAEPAAAAAQPPTVKAPVQVPDPRVEPTVAAAARPPTAKTHGQVTVSEPHVIPPRWPHATAPIMAKAPVQVSEPHVIPPLVVPMVCPPVTRPRCPMPPRGPPPPSIFGATPKSLPESEQRAAKRPRCEGDAPAGGAEGAPADDDKGAPAALADGAEDNQPTPIVRFAPPPRRGSVAETQARFEEALRTAAQTWFGARSAWRDFTMAMVAADRVDEVHIANDSYGLIWESWLDEASGRNGAKHEPGHPRRS